MSKKAKNIVLFTCLFLALSIVFAIIFILKPTSTSEEPVEVDPRSFEEMFWESGDSSIAIEDFDQKINQTTDENEKAKLYNERSKFLFELPFDGKNIFKDQIISDLKARDSIEKSADSAYILYDRYSFFGEDENAEYYLKLYNNRTMNELEQ